MIMHINTETIRVAAELGTTLKTRRKQLGLDQSELSLVAGVSRRTIHAIEHGKPTVQLAALVAVLQAAGLSLEARPRESRRSHDGLR